MTIRCNHCNGDEIEQAHWVDANSGALGDPIDHGTGSFCRDCDAPCVGLDDEVEAERARMRTIPPPASSPPPDEEPCECDEDVLPGAGWPFNERAEVQRCDLCQRFDTDDHATDAVVELLNRYGAQGVVPDLGYGSTLDDDGHAVLTHKVFGKVVVMEYQLAEELHTELTKHLRWERTMRALLDRIHGEEIAGHFPRELLLEADRLVTPSCRGEQISGVCVLHPEQCPVKEAS